MGLSWQEAVDRRFHHAEPNGTTSLPPTDNATDTPYGLSALADECAQVSATQPGGRNDRLNLAAFRMARLIPHQLTFATAATDLARAGADCGLPAHEVELVLRDDPHGALWSGQAAPRTPDDREPPPPVSELAEPAQPAMVAIRERFPLLDWQELWQATDEQEWIVEPLLPARRLVALFSPPKVGKSLLMLEVAVAIARGDAALGVQVAQARVLYVDFENDPVGDIRERLEAMGRKPDELDGLCYLSYPSLAKLDSLAGAAELLAVVQEYQCTVVVIDTISRAVGGEENENDTWLNFYRHTGLALKQAGVSCIRLDHTGKDHERGMRGGSAKYGDVDMVWKLSRVTASSYALECTDHRLPVPTAHMTIERVETPYLAHKLSGTGWTADRDSKVGQVIQALDETYTPTTTGRRQVRNILRDLNLGASNSVIDAAIGERKLRAPEEGSG